VKVKNGKEKKPRGLFHAAYALEVVFYTCIPGICIFIELYRDICIVFMADIHNNLCAA
jgi:hypothetical protein